MREDPDQVLESLGRRVAERRQELGLTQKDLADKLGIAHQNIHLIEQGKRNMTVRTMVALADALGMRTAELFDEAPTRRARRT